MGSAEARCYLASPAVVAASAMAGFITGPGSSETTAPKRRLVRHAPVAPALESAASATAETITGRLVVFLKDGIDSDALCPARLVYTDNASRDELARAVFGSIDPAFASQVRSGDVLVCGARFGTGSSREQAVTALFAAGIKAVVAESLAPVFRRNAWNNGFPAIERPELLKALRSRFTATPTAATFTNETITVDLGWLPDVARELIAAGGLDAFLRMRVAEDGD
jgi:homoaconitate hydratase